MIIMGLLIVILLIIMLFLCIFFFLDMKAYEANLDLVFSTLRYLIIIFISFLIFVLYLMYTYKVEPGNINLFTIKHVIAVICGFILIFLILAEILIRRKVYPKFQKKYGLKSIREMRGMSFLNKKKMIKKWENDRADREDYKP